LETAKTSREKLDNFIVRLKETESEEQNPKVKEAIDKAKHDFMLAMDDDLNISSALASVFDFMREINKLKISKEDSENVLEFMKKIDSIIGVINFEQEAVPKEIIDLVEQREKARKSKNWEESDRIRDELKEKGYSVEDTKQGPRCRKIS
jgi:cysteinyl-tRNA synthetase